MQFILLILLIALIIAAFVSYLLMVTLIKMIYLTKGVALLVVCSLGLLLFMMIGFIIYWVMNGSSFLSIHKKIVRLHLTITI